MGYVPKSMSECKYMLYLMTVTETLLRTTATAFLLSSDILVLKIILVLVFIQFYVNNFDFSFSFSFEIILVSVSVLVSVLK